MSPQTLARWTSCALAAAAVATLHAQAPDPDKSWPLAGDAQDPSTSAAFAAARDAILPKADDVGWRAVPWRAELRQALVEADAAGKPVLLWAMNGHPLGQC